MGFTTLTPLPLNNPHLWDNSGPFKTNPLSVLSRKPSERFESGVSNLLMRADTESQEKTLSTSIDYGYPASP
nr:MAG TPA: hypothetical protein [Caudoviricetes sp.]